jgi:hypothetical protein
MSDESTRPSPEFVAAWSSLWPMLMAHPKARVAYTDRQSIAVAARMYEQVLCDVPVSALTAAVYQSLAECEWFPSPAELRKFAGVVMSPDRPTAIEGWAEVLEAMRSHHSGLVYSWRNLTAKAVVEAMGGLYNLRMSGQPESDRRTFCSAYEKIAAREEQRERLVPIARALAEAQGGEMPARAPLALPERRPLSPTETAELARAIRENAG